MIDCVCVCVGLWETLSNKPVNSADSYRWKIPHVSELCSRRKHTQHFFVFHLCQSDDSSFFYLLFAFSLGLNLMVWCHTKICPFFLSCVWFPKCCAGRQKFSLYLQLFQPTISPPVTVYVYVLFVHHSNIWWLSQLLTSTHYFLLCAVAVLTPTATTHKQSNVLTVLVFSGRTTLTHSARCPPESASSWEDT